MRADRRRVKRTRRTLLRAALELANAANGVHPLARDGYITLPVFAFGWPTTELSPWLAGTSILDAIRRGGRGDFRGKAGALSLGMTVASWALLAVIHRRNVGSAPHFEDALRQTLDGDYTPAERAGRLSVATGIFRAGAARLRYVGRAASLRYGPYRANQLDIWRRRDLPRDGKAPVLVNIPGGAWVIGMRRPQAYPLLGHLTAQGWICVSVGYRVSPRHTWPEHIVDIKRALAWVRANIADYGGDPDMLFLSGESAGGHLAALSALTAGDPVWQPGFEDADTSVRAVVPVYGRYDWESTDGPGRTQFVRGFLQRLVVKKDLDSHRETYREASPIHRVHPEAPPFFVLHGQNDSIIPVGEARDFVAALRAVSQAPVAYAEIPGAQHAFDIFGSPRGQYTAVAIQRFLDWVRRH
ncbi:MAG: alpha/beta hydrolase [Mycobacterium sp.]|nr:alpha/beta hydrolase [Mycobacterium sp.]